MDLLPPNHARSNMTFIALTNIFLIVLFVFTMLFVRWRNRKLKQAYLARLLKQPETFEWLSRNLSDNNAEDIQAIRTHFGLPLQESKQLINIFRSQNPGKR
ncbi:hypothetical protein RSJ68_06050 [Neisseria sp. DTU_2020_1000833_1_SI_GRL_NUU_006]|nr:hypothetical protein RSJ68_06050 [Neisseria sp. DTU_2020_1000833_1_SI_GRL_NUU_006]